MISPGPAGNTWRPSGGKTAASAPSARTHVVQSPSSPSRGAAAAAAWVGSAAASRPYSTASLFSAKLNTSSEDDFPALGLGAHQKGLKMFLVF